MSVHMAVVNDIRHGSCGGERKLRAASEISLRPLTIRIVGPYWLWT